MFKLHFAETQGFSGNVLVAFSYHSISKILDFPHLQKFFNTLSTTLTLELPYFSFISSVQESVICT